MFTECGNCHQSQIEIKSPRADGSYDAWCSCCGQVFGFLYSKNANDSNSGNSSHS